MTLRNYASRISLSKAAAGSEVPVPVPLWSSYSLGNETWTAIKTTGFCPSWLMWLLGCIPVWPHCQDLAVPTHTPLDEPGIWFPALLRDPPEPWEWEHWQHIETVSLPQGQNSYTQIFLRCLPNVLLKAVSIAILFPCCKLRHYHLSCPQWAENTAYAFHNNLAWKPWLLKGSATLSHCFPVDAFSETLPFFGHFDLAILSLSKSLCWN